MKIFNFCKSYENRRRSLMARLAIASTLSAGLCLAFVGAGQRAPADTGPQARRVPMRHWQPNVAMHTNPVAPILPNDEPIQLCQVLTPADPNPIPAVDCTRDCPPDGAGGWDYMGPVTGFQEWAQGEYVGRARLPHVPTYRLRVDDQLNFVFRVTRNEISTPYQLNVGDEVTIESTTDRELRRNVDRATRRHDYFADDRRNASCRLERAAVAQLAREVVQGILQSPRHHGHAGAASTRSSKTCAIPFRAGRASADRLCKAASRRKARFSCPRWAACRHRA